MKPEAQRPPLVAPSTQHLLCRAPYPPFGIRISAFFRISGTRTSKFGINGLLFSGLAALSISGCKTASLSPAQNIDSTNTPVVAAASAAPKKVINVPKSKPTTAQKFNPLFWFGNMDDPVPPDWYRPKNRMRKVLWNLRNPLHNFFFYVVGIADKEFEIVGRVPGRISNPDGGWNWTVCKYKCLRLPFISYKRGGFNFYLGWRNHGNFGMKLNYSK